MQGSSRGKITSLNLYISISCFRIRLYSSGQARAPKIWLTIYTKSSNIMPMLGFKTAAEVRQKNRKRSARHSTKKIVSVNENKMSSFYPCSSAVLGNIGSITGLKESKRESSTIQFAGNKRTKSYCLRWHIIQIAVSSQWKFRR